MDIAGTGSLAGPIACLDRTRANDDLVVVFVQLWLLLLSAIQDVTSKTFGQNDPIYLYTTTIAACSCLEQPI